MKKLIWIALWFFSVSFAWADATYDTCIDQSDGTNGAWALCGGDWLQRADRELNSVWKKVYAATSNQTRKDLLSEQRLWNAYKESSCDFYTNGMWGREGHVLGFPACRVGVIESRIRQLEVYGELFSGH